MELDFRDENRIPRKRCDGILCARLSRTTQADRRQTFCALVIYRFLQEPKLIRVFDEHVRPYISDGQIVEFEKRVEFIRKSSRYFLAKIVCYSSARVFHRLITCLHGWFHYATDDTSHHICQFLNDDPIRSIPNRHDRGMGPVELFCDPCIV